MIGDDCKQPPRRLAIIGGGSSGLITLKTALDELPNWELVCFERSDQITGCWGNPYPGFVSTSTKYTTQFACYCVFDGTINPDGGTEKQEFFRDGEYGEYLNGFADEFDLRRHIKLNCAVRAIRRSESGVGWELTIHTLEAGQESAATELFDQVIVCTGLAATATPVDCQIPTLSAAQLNDPRGLDDYRNRRIVVIGGGETAVDYANRLSRPELGNDVYLSLHSGIRVSPRYHPIRGVPSDFLRSRLMLSIHQNMRNWIGQRFVECRIKYQEAFERWFPASKSAGQSRPTNDDSSYDVGLRKQWAYRLTKAAKDDLFNMFHNKSDDFLEAVAERRLSIVGAPTNDTFRRYYEFQSQESREICPDFIVPAIGYRSQLDDLFRESMTLSDFYLGCCHITHCDLFLVGFARPILGNIPTISEMQARYVCGLIAGKFARSGQTSDLHARDLKRLRQSYPKLNTQFVYPVEMFPYCDRLAKLMNQMPRLRSTGSLVSWCRTQLGPASTMHYLYRDARVRQRYESTPVYLPVLLVCLLLALKPIDWTYRLVRFLTGGFR